jgi:uncharacterized protein
MTTLQQIELQCPVCKNRFHSQAIASTNCFGGKRTDFHERAAGTQPLPYQLHNCNRCGFTATECDFTEGVEVSSTLRDRVYDLYPGIIKVPGSGSQKYEAAAKIAEWQGKKPHVVARLLLRAAWCCVDEGDIEAERFFRRKAAWAFEEALSSTDRTTSGHKALWTYLIGELWRRIGDGPLAREWFNRVEDAIVDPSTQQGILDAARQQRDCPREWFR